MKLQDIYNQLAYGELRLLNIGSGDIDAETDGFPEASFIKILPTVQLGITELHKRFTLREGRVTIPLVDGQSTYVLTKKLSAPEDFEENLLKIERIYGTYRDQDYEIPLNKISNPQAIRTTSFNTLLIPDDSEKAPWLKETSSLKVVYRADHPKININLAQAAPLAVDIDLPVTHLQALLYFIASRMHNPMGMNDQIHDGNNYAQKFQQEVQNLSLMNYEVDDDEDNQRITDHGWP